MNEDNLGIQEKAAKLAAVLYRGNAKKQSELVARLIDTYYKAVDKEVLVIHSPGGWGCTDIANLIAWEKSVVEGVQSALTEMGTDWVLVQFFRAGKSKWNHFKHIPQQTVNFFSGKTRLVPVLAGELQFLAENIKGLKILLLGASQGAAFNNEVMKNVKNTYEIYSVELGTFFAQLPRRVITSKTLAIDSNGLMMDPVVHWNFLKTLRAYVQAPFSWLKYKMAGEPVKFTVCINVPGHDYNWEYLSVRSQVTKFLEANLGAKKPGTKVEGSKV
jgi:hypothetical protein